MSRRLGPLFASMAASLALAGCGLGDKDKAADAAPAAVATAPAAAPAIELVIFEADWCPNSRATEEALTEYQAAHPGRVNITRVNIETHRDAFDTYGVTATPTIVFQRDGRPVHRHVGAIVDVETMHNTVTAATAEKTLSQDLQASRTPAPATNVAAAPRPR